MASSARNRSLAAIHAGRRALRWDEEAYRSYLEQLIGKRSASECTDAELAHVLDDMRQHGYARKPGAATAAAPRKRASQLDKARALWNDLAAMGQLSNPSEEGFRAFVERITKRSRPEWCTPAQLVVVIEGLKGWRKRVSDARGRDDHRPAE